MSNELRNALIGHYIARVFVESKHGTMLEFTLRAAEQRRYDRGRPLPKRAFSDGVTEATYIDLLVEMINARLKTAEAACVEWDAYGEVSVVIEAPTLTTLNDAITITDQAIGDWKRKYRVEQMKVPD